MQLVNETNILPPKQSTSSRKKKWTVLNYPSKSLDHNTIEPSFHLKRRLNDAIPEQKIPALCHVNLSKYDNEDCKSLFISIDCRLDVVITCKSLQPHI